MKLVLWLAAIAIFVAVYVIWVRPYLKSLPALRDIYARLDAREQSWGKAIFLWARGRRTILVGIWGEIIAFAPDALQHIQGLDLKTLLNLPDSWAAWVTAVIPLLMLIFRAKAAPTANAV